MLDFAHPPEMLLVLLWGEGLLATVNLRQPRASFGTLRSADLTIAHILSSLAGLNGRLPFSTQPSASSLWPSLHCFPPLSLHKALGSDLLASLCLSETQLFPEDTLLLKRYHLFFQVHKMGGGGRMSSQPALGSLFPIVSNTSPRFQLGKLLAASNRRPD